MSNSTPSEARPISVQFREYVNRMGWLIGDLISQFRNRIITLIVVDGLASLLILIWLAGLLAYGRALETEAPISFRSFEINVGTDIQSILLYVGVLSIAGLAGGLLLYRSEWITANLTIDYHRKCPQKIARCDQRSSQ